MRLLEYEAKSLLEERNILIPHANLVKLSGYGRNLQPLAFPVVVKSQVPVGGRGKVGGIKLANDPDEYRRVIDGIGALVIKGYRPKTLLVEQALDIAKEFYLSIVINRAAATIDMIAHREGGVEIESQADFATYILHNHSFSRVGESLAELYGIEDKSFILADWAEKLYHCFVDNDATLLEINPLILTKQGELVAGDCKMTLDDDAAFRHPEWDFEDKPANSNFVTLNTHGTVATIANGAGLAMATVDAVKAAGLTPANFLDIGGGATVESITKSFAQIMELDDVTAIIINIFGGIVRCDDVANAIIAAKDDFANLPRLYIRLSGTNSEQAADILISAGLSLYPDLAACIKGVSHG